MNLKTKIICKIIEQVSLEMGFGSTDEFFELIDHDMKDVMIGIKLPSTDKLVLYYLKEDYDCRFFLPYEIDRL